MNTADLFDVKVSHVSNSIESWRGSFTGGVPSPVKIIAVISAERDEIYETDFDGDEIAEDVSHERGTELDTLIDVLRHLPDNPFEFRGDECSESAIVSRVLIGQVHIKRRKVYQ